MTCTLTEILQYKNIHVLNRYQKDFPNSSISAEEAFTELLKYIWLVAKQANDKSNNPKNVNLNFTCSMHEEMIDIDNMWHTFLLFTKDYHDFCTRYLAGHFLHHFPEIEKENKLTGQEYANELNNYLSYIYENLGAETVMKWFNIFSENFD